ILGTTNTYTGGTIISGGILQVGNAGTTGSILGNVTDNATFTFNRSDNYLFPGNISGTGVVNQSGTGILTLTGNNTYTGGTNVNAGTLAITTDANLGTGALTIAVGSVEIAGSLSSPRNIVLSSSSAAIQVDGSKVYTALSSASVSGSGGLNKNGLG